MRSDFSKHKMNVLGGRCGAAGGEEHFCFDVYIYVSDPKIIPKCIKINLKMTPPKKKKELEQKTDHKN